MIFVVAGTSEAREVIKELLKRKRKVVASITTDFGASLLEKDNYLKIINRCMDENDFTKTFKKYDVKYVIDASHPYATEVSENVMNAADNVPCKYVRFERESFHFSDQYNNVLTLNNFEEAAKFLKNTSGNILLTIGSKELSKFTDEIDRERVFARVLPMSNMIKKCEISRLSASNIIGIKGPFSKDLNSVLIKDFKIKYLVTKESGFSGGLQEKLDAAMEAGIEVLLIKRKKIKYPIVFNKIKLVIKFIEDNYVD